MSDSEGEEEEEESELPPESLQAVEEGNGSLSNKPSIEKDSDPVPCPSSSVQKCATPSIPSDSSGGSSETNQKAMDGSSCHKQGDAQVQANHDYEVGNSSSMSELNLQHNYCPTAYRPWSIRVCRRACECWGRETKGNSSITRTKVWRDTNATSITIVLNKGKNKGTA